MSVDVIVPAVGESIKEAMISRWVKADGDVVQMDEVLAELETDKATVEIVAQTSGQLSHIKKQGETIEVGTVIAKIDPSKAGSAPKEPKNEKTLNSSPSQQSTPIPASSQSTSSQSKQDLSPAVQRIVKENNLNPESIAGTGKGGRLTKEDVVLHLDAKNSTSVKTSSSNTQVSASSPNHTTATVHSSGSRGTKRVPMSMLRRKIAERLVQAQHTAAILTTFNEIDMSQIMALRSRYKDSFKEKYAINLGFMSFFVKAVVEALKTFPAINGYIEGTDMIYHDYCDIGVAVSSDKGLVVPVVKNCESMNLAQLEKAIADYAIKARDGKITIDDLSGGTFTVSNGGVFGSLLSTPILNPPQSGILGMHKIEQRPVVVDGQIVIRPMMYVALSYDHRIVDGKEAVGFLVKVKECIEDPARMLIGV